MTDNSNGVVILITLLNILVYKLQKLQEAQKTNRIPLSARQLCRRFSLRDIMWATNNFHDDLVIGRGGFGNVYKGIIGLGENHVAIKRLKSKSKQGMKEFHTEIEMLTKFQHSHIVSLLGYCDDREEMILVYEYMPCGNFADHLHRRLKKGDVSLPSLSWEQRLKICIGAAHGLDYLHTGTSIENRVIHRDVKTTNILLDENLEAKIADFGLSKTGPANQTCTYVSTRVKGTIGYLDPYYVSTRRITRKCDVYAFGVVLFEALCGRPAVDPSLDEEQINLAGWVQHCFKEGILDKLIDPRIKENISSDSLNAFVDVAIKCLDFRPKLRPNMAEVVVSLESALTLQEKSTHYSLVEILPIDDTQEDIDSSQHEIKDTNEKFKSQFSSKMTYKKGVNFLLSVTARMLSVNRNVRTSSTNRKSGLPVYPSVTPRTWNEEEDLHSSKLKIFALKDLSVATRNFHQKSFLGEGVFGCAFKGWVHEKSFAAAKWGTGLAIVVKRLNQESLSYHAWFAEINCLGKLNHPNIVKLIGYCLGGEHRFLVYDFIPRGSLANHLFRRGSDTQPLSWKLRMSIALDAAKGLAYLHSPEVNVIHRDFKTSIILIDSKFNAKISAFGLAKDGAEHGETHVSTDIKGTACYIAPEYVATGHLTLKSDVHGFGVVLIEILTGKSVYELLCASEEGINSWAKSYLTCEATLLDIMDADIQGQYTVEEALRASSLAIKCVSVDPKLRPDANQVVKALEEL